MADGGQGLRRASGCHSHCGILGESHLLLPPRLPHLQNSPWALKSLWPVVCTKPSVMTSPHLLRDPLLGEASAAVQALLVGVRTALSGTRWAGPAQGLPS